MVFVGVVQPFQRMRFVSQAGVDERNLIGCDVTLLRQVLQSSQELSRLGFVARYRIDVSQRAERSRLAEITYRFLARRDCLIKSLHLLVSHGKEHVCRREIWLHLESLTKLCD